MYICINSRSEKFFLLPLTTEPPPPHLFSIGISKDFMNHFPIRQFPTCNNLPTAMCIEFIAKSIERLIIFPSNQVFCCNLLPHKSTILPTHGRMALAILKITRNLQRDTEMLRRKKIINLSYSAQRRNY